MVIGAWCGLSILAIGMFFPQFANQFMVLLPKFAEIVCVCLSRVRGVLRGVADLTHIGESVWVNLSVCECPISARRVLRAEW